MLGGMDTRALIVRSALGWALRTTLAIESAGGSTPGPRLAQVRLGDLMSRSEPETLASIVADIREQGEPFDELVAQVRSGWGEERRTRTRRTVLDEAYHVATEMCLAARRHVRGRELVLLELGSRMRTWKSIEPHFPGRDWQSLRDDFAVTALRLYVAEKNITCATADFVVKVDTMRGVRR